MSHPYMAKAVVADQFVKEVVRLHEVPQTIINDTDLLFRELFQLQGLFYMRSSYHSVIDGHTEILNRCLETY